MFAGKDIKLTSGADTTIVASVVGAQGSGEISAGGNVNIMAGIESAYHEEEHWEQSFGGLVAGLSEGRAYAGISYNITEESSKSYDEYAKASVLDFGGGLRVSANKDVNIIGSSIGAQSAEVTAENINILAQAEKHSSSREKKEGTLEVTAGVGNSYVDAAYTAIELGDAIKAEGDAGAELERIRQLHSDGKATDGALEGAIANLAAATANVVQATINAGTASVKAGSTSFLLGMYGDIKTEARYTETTTNSAAVTNLGSSFGTVSDLVLKSKNDITQTGSSVSSTSGDIMYDAGGNINMLASQNTSAYAAQQNSYTISASMGSYGAAMPSPSGAGTGISESSQSGQTTTNINSVSVAENGKITYKAGGDLTGKGYNAYAQEIVADITGDLTLESMQDTALSNSSGISFGAGYGKQSGVTGNIGVNGSNSESAWVTNVTGLVGTNSVEINVGNNTHMQGAVIANITEEGTDGGNLVLNTGSLTYGNINDKMISDENGFGLSMKTGSELDFMSGALKHGETDLALSSGGYAKEQKTMATIGTGTVNITDGSGAEINRDTAAVQTITRDEVTGALDMELKVDHRWFSEEGRKEMNPVAQYMLRQAAVDDFAKEAIARGEDVTLGWLTGIDDVARMGKETYVIGKNETSEGFNTAYPDKKPEDLNDWQRVITPFDINPLLSELYKLPLMKAATLYHDAEYKISGKKDDESLKRDAIKQGLALQLSIPSSFMGTWYSVIFGKPFAPKAAPTNGVKK